MSTWFVNEKISSVEVGGFIAEAILHDLRVNSFTFTGFPEVFVRWDDNAFYVSLGLSGNKTSELELDYSTVKKCIGLFRENKLVDQVMIRKIQDLVVEVEGFGRVAPSKVDYKDA